MIIQFRPSAGGPETPADSPRPSYHSWNWLQENGSSNGAIEWDHTPEYSSKIVNFRSAHADEPACLANYVEEVKAKTFKGANSVSLFIEDEMRPIAVRELIGQSTTEFTTLQFVEARRELEEARSLPDAA